MNGRLQANDSEDENGKGRVVAFICATRLYPRLSAVYSRLPSDAQ